MAHRSNGEARTIADCQQLRGFAEARCDAIPSTRFIVAAQDPQHDAGGEQRQTELHCM
ncbi:hypothetical protein N9N48_07595 [Luminiphilus sp.]|nr:hypothetical protein [Luminiphilus sp.]